MALLNFVVLLLLVFASHLILAQDLSECFALPHKGYELVQVEKILLEYEVDQTLQYAVTADKTLERTYNNIPNYGTDDLSILIDTLQTFTTDCYESFYENVVNVNDMLSKSL